MDMTYLELFPVVVAILVWGQSLANLLILFYIDNQVVVHIVNEQTSKSSEVMTLVRKLSFLTFLLRPSTSILNPVLLHIIFLVVSGIVFAIWRLRQIQTQFHYPQLSWSVDSGNQ